MQVDTPDKMPDPENYTPSRVLDKEDSNDFSSFAGLQEGPATAALFRCFNPAYNSSYHNPQLLQEALLLLHADQPHLERSSLSLLPAPCSPCSAPASSPFAAHTRQPLCGRRQLPVQPVGLRVRHRL